MVKIAVIDCYDSFVYNLVELLRCEEGVEYKVIGYNEMISCRSQCSSDGAIAIEEITQQYEGILLSPGPATPQDFPLLKSLIQKAEGRTTLLGVCLGMQSLACAYGGTLRPLAKPSHGFEDSLVFTASDPFFEGLTTKDTVGRYHSWVVDSLLLPKEMKVLATAQSDGTLMALRHTELPFYGVQFHPESYITTHSESYIRNWLKITSLYKNKA